MKAHVLRDPGLVKLAGRFVWLSIDAEKEENASALDRFPTSGYPTYLVLEPAEGKPVLRWYGSASAARFRRLLDDALLAISAAGGSPPEVALLAADRANAEGRAEEAAAGYRQALRLGGGKWDRRGRAVESLIVALAGRGKYEECAAAARAEGAALPAGDSRASALAAGLGCALEEDGDPRPPWRAPAIAALEPLVAEAAKTPGLLADDRAGILQALLQARQDAGDESGARAAARRLWKLLADEARRVPSAELRASLDSYRVSAALALGQPGLAVPPIQGSEKALPDDYNPPYRLAILYQEMGRPADALAAADRALARAYGPRKLRIYSLKAQVLEASGDRAALEATLAEALAHAASLPPVQRKGTAGLVARMQAKLEALRRS